MTKTENKQENRYEEPRNGEEQNKTKDVTRKGVEQNIAL